MSIAGFSSASINFGLNVAAVGATLPLQINEGLITPDGSALGAFAILSSSADTTLSATGGHQGYLAAPSAARTVTLPSTGIKAGYRYRLEIAGATETNFVKLQSSGANEVDRIGGDGFIEVMALQDTPTAAAHWRILDVQETSGTFTTAATGANTSTITYTLTRNRNVASIAAVQGLGAAAASNNIKFANAIPQRFRPSVQQNVVRSVVSATTEVGGVVQILTSGIVEFYIFNGATYTTNCGLGTTYQPCFYRLNV